MSPNAPTWILGDRTQAEIGDLLDTHESGPSFEELERYGLTPFIKDVLKLKLTPDQEAGAQILERGDRQCMLLGGNGLGKDVLMGAWALWMAFSRGALAILTGPVDRTIRESQMRRTVGWLWRRAGLPGEQFEMAIRLPGRPRQGILAFSASSAETFVSHHAPNLVVGVTEGQGMSAELFEGIHRLQPKQLVVTANPTTPNCALYGFSKSPSWTVRSWSATNHPNVISGQELFPGAVTTEWVEDRRREQGAGSRFWKVAVLGEWPETSESSLFSPERWQDIRERGAETEAEANSVARRSDKNWHCVLGVDISRGGEDYTAIAVRRGPLLHQLLRWKEPDTQTNAERIAGVVRDLLHKEHLGVWSVVVDETGDGGGVYDRLVRIFEHDKHRKEHPFTFTEIVGGEKWRPRYRNHTVQAIGFKSSRSAPQSERFSNLRAQAFWHLGAEIEEGITAIRPRCDSDLVDLLKEELFVHERIHMADQRIAIGSKDEIRRVLGRSPDLADAWAMSYSPVLSGPPKRKKAGYFAGAAAGGWIR